MLLIMKNFTPITLYDVLYEITMSLRCLGMNIYTKTIQWLQFYISLNKLTTLIIY